MAKTEVHNSTWLLKSPLLLFSTKFALCMDTCTFGTVSKGQQLLCSTYYLWTSWEQYKCSITAPTLTQLYPVLKLASFAIFVWFLRSPHVTAVILLKCFPFEMAPNVCVSIPSLSSPSKLLADSSFLLITSLLSVSFQLFHWLAIVLNNLLLLLLIFKTLNHYPSLHLFALVFFPIHWQLCWIQYTLSSFLTAIDTSI